MAVWDFDEPGIYTLRLALREKGTAVAEIALIPIFVKDPASRSPGQYQKYPRRHIEGMTSTIYDLDTWGAGIGFEDNERDQENDHTQSGQDQRYPRRSIEGMTSQMIYVDQTWFDNFGFEDNEPDQENNNTP